MLAVGTRIDVVGESAPVSLGQSEGGHWLRGALKVWQLLSHCVEL
jgi:hypothetical protein